MLEFNKLLVYSIYSLTYSDKWIYTFHEKILKTIYPEPEFFKRLRSPGLDSEESIQPAYVAWQAGTTCRGYRTGPPGWESIPVYIALTFIFLRYKL
jgi:hypothetical protein